MYNRNDPRFRRTLNQISQNLESANESAQVGLFSFSEHYVKPCLGSIAAYLEPCTAACFPTQRDRLRRQHRTRGTRGRLEHSFDFYDDWEEDENDALLSLEGDEFHRVVGGYGTQGEPVEPLAPRAASMNYGARREALLSPRARKKSAVLPYDSGPDPTVIPNQSYFGFLTKLPFNIGRGALRYKPSAADLQVRPKGAERFSNEEERLLEEDEDGDDGAGASQQPFKRQGRNRSSTTGSGHTTDSYSSRGDIFPSDDEDDAVPIDDEFTISLERRTTHTGHEDSGSSKNKGRKRGDSLQPSSDPPSSKSSRKGRRRSRKSSSSTARSQTSDPEMGELATLSALKQEEQRAKAEEEEEVEKKREAAQKLAIERGLATPERIAATESVAPKVEKDMAKPLEALSAPEDDPQLNEDHVVVDVAPGPISMEDNEQHSSPHPRESE